MKQKTARPEYVFSYPDGWKITTEDYDGSENMLTKEYVILSNKRGVEIAFSRYEASDEGLGGYGEIMNEYQVKKVADSAFVPSYPKYAGDDDSQIEEFMVEYGEYFSFIASALDGTFTQKETEDVIEILSTFRPTE